MLDIKAMHIAWETCDWMRHMTSSSTQMPVSDGSEKFPAPIVGQRECPSSDGGSSNVPKQFEALIASFSDQRDDVPVRARSVCRGGTTISVHRLHLLQAYRSTQYGCFDADTSAMIDQGFHQAAIKKTNDPTRPIPSAQYVRAFDTRQNPTTTNGRSGLGFRLGITSLRHKNR